MKVESIDHTSPYLKAVKALGKANAGTLGLFPEGAFDDYAKRGTILIAVNDQGQCVGYLLYRVTRGYASIVHLCVDASARGSGIARLLFDALHNITQPLRGIRADCRRDYSANMMWPRLGFCAINERLGRAKKRTTLTVWWLDHGHPDLFTMAALKQDEVKLRVAIDANVFYDLRNPQRPDHNESRALLADWLKADVDLGVSSELWNEINRGNDEAERQRARKDAEQLTRFSSSHAAFETAQSSLRQFFPENMSQNDEADLRQLARAIAAKVPFFVTRDRYLLSQSDGIYQTYGVSILRPSDLIVHLDELRHGGEYQPVRLAGTSMELRRVQSKEHATFGAIFQHAVQGETRVEFDRTIRRLLAMPTTHECLLALDDSHAPLTLIAYDRSQPDKLIIPLFRARRGPLAATLVRYNILAMLTRSAHERRTITCISDPHLDDTIIAALQEDSFLHTADGWVKINIAVAEPAHTLARRLTVLGGVDPLFTEYVQLIANVLKTPDVTHDVRAMVDVERLLWPVKVVDADIPTFLVPIQPVWAHELFDVQLANQTLFGSMKQLVLNREAVYYKSSKHQILNAPGRILWYVSRGKKHGYQGGSEVRACSRLDEVTIGLPKDLYRRFRRFGIYDWPHVLGLAKENVSQPIMALRFSNTELFTTPVPLPELRAVYASFGEGLSVQGATRLPNPQIFAHIYRRGMNIAGHESSMSADISYS